MSGRRSRNKGKAFEQKVARELREIFGEQVARGWQSRSGDNAPDIVGCGPLWVEAKHHKLAPIRGAIRQAQAAQKAYSEHHPDNPLPYVMAVTKDDRTKPLVTMEWEVFKELLAEWWELKCKEESDG